MSCILAGLALSLCSDSQTPQLAPNANRDYSKEAFVIEKVLSKIAFENDGTSTRIDHPHPHSV